MSQIYLSGYWDVKTGDLHPEHTKHGYFNKHSHGGASIWTLGSEPHELFPDSFLWKIPYNGTRYVYVFSPYDDKKPLRELSLWNVIKQYVSEDAQSQLREVSSSGAHQVYIYQTNDIIPGYDINADQWDPAGIESDILESSYTVIDTQKIEEIEINWVENLKRRLEEINNINDRKFDGLNDMFDE